MDQLLDPSNLHPLGLLKSGIKFGVGLYLDHKAKKICERVLTAEFAKLIGQGYLSVSESDESLVVTDKALTDMIGLTVYPDILAFAEEYQFSAEEMKLLTKTRVNIRMTKKLPAWDKRVGSAWPEGMAVARQIRQRASTVMGGWQRPSGVGPKQSLNQALAYFLNAEAALVNSKDPNDTPMAIVTRAIGLAQLCGIDEIGLLDIIEGLSMSFMFETMARQMVASTRGLHGTQVYNMGLHMKGSSENVFVDFPVKAKSFLGPREVIGRWTATGVVLDGINVKVVARPNVNMPKEGEEIWCMSGWAEALRRHTTKANEMVGKDIHGSLLECDKKSVVKLSLKRVDGILMVKIKQIGTRLIINAKFCSGIIGVPCPCDTPDPRKRVGPNAKIGKLKVVFVSGPEGLNVNPRETVSVLKTYNDAIARTFLCLFLMSSYLREEKECLHCAVSRAAGAGCNVVLL